MTSMLKSKLTLEIISDHETLNTFVPLRPCGPSGPGRPLPGSPALPLGPFCPDGKKHKKKISQNISKQ